MLRAVVVLIRRDAEVATWPLSTAHLDLSVIDEGARLRLAAVRLGCTVELRQVCPELRELLDLVGLGVEVSRKAECSEQVRVEEVVMPDDPVA